MNFNVYDRTLLSDNDVQKWSDGDEPSFKINPVESGLSAGELRQSLLDRFRSALKRGDSDAVAETIEDFFFLTIRGDDSDQIVHDIDELLYLADDGDLLGEWDFGSGKIILVVEEEK